MEPNVTLTAQRFMMLQDRKQPLMASQSPMCCDIADRKSKSVHKALLCSQLSRRSGEEGKKTKENEKESC